MVLLKKTTDPRPVFLNLLKIRLPLNALVSILHRISGVIMILALPLLVLALAGAVSKPGIFRYMAIIPYFLWKGAIAAILIAYMYHILAGIRHIYHDFSGHHSLEATNRSSVVVLVAWTVWIIVVGSKLWLV